MKLRPSSTGFRFWCPGCACAHHVRVGQPDHPVWAFNGDHEAPTFTPSVLVRAVDPDGEFPPETLCHLYVTKGEIEFLGDCSHALKGQKVPLPDFPK